MVEYFRLSKRHDGRCTGVRAVATAALFGTILLAGVAPRFTRGDEKADAKRIERLESLALSLEKVQEDRAAKPVHQVSGTRRYSSRSEVHFRFLPCLTALEENGRDALVLVPVQFSGYSYTVRDQEAPKRNSGADAKKVRVSIQDFLGGKTSKADIAVPPLEHGSTFDLEQLVRDEIQVRLEFYFPDMQISGKKKYLLKEVEVENDTDESIRVWYRYRTRRVAKSGYEWFWMPDRDENPQSVVISKKTTKKLIADDESPLLASRLYIWAEGDDSGDRWTANRTEPLVLIEKNPKLGGSRGYHATQPRVYQHEVESHATERVFTERVLKFKNATPDSLRVSLKYRGRGSTGLLAWRSAECTVGPGETVTPKGERGSLIRASRVYFSAESTNRKFNKYTTEPLWLVAKQNGQRAYLGDKIGAYQYTFEAIAKGASGATATVISRSAEVKSGSKVLARLPVGKKFEVQETQGDWVRIRYQADGESKRGWVAKRHLKLEAPTPQSRPDVEQKTVVVVSTTADIKVGTENVGQIRRGERFRVLESRDGWYFIEFALEGGSAYGWVSRRYVRETD